MTHALYRTPKCGQCTAHPPCDKGKTCCTCRETTCNGRQRCADTGPADVPTHPPVETPEVIKPGRGRPTKVMQLVEVRTLSERITKINEYHTRVNGSLLAMAGYAVLAGFELLAVKATEHGKHGKWEKWVKANCNFHITTAWRYMAMAERRCKKVSNLATLQDLIEGKLPHELPPHQREKLVKAVMDSCDGMTAQELAIDAGVVKAPRNYTHIGGNADLRAWLAKVHPEITARKLADLQKEIGEEFETYCEEREAEEKAKRDPLSVATAADLEAANCIGLWDKLIADLRQFVLVRKGHAHVAPQTLKNGIESLKDCVRELSDDLARQSS